MYILAKVNKLYYDTAMFAKNLKRKFENRHVIALVKFSIELKLSFLS